MHPSISRVHFCCIPLIVRMLDTVIPGLSTDFLVDMTRNPGALHASGVSQARLPGVSQARLPGVSQARLPGVSQARLPGFRLSPE